MGYSDLISELGLVEVREELAEKKFVFLKPVFSDLFDVLSFDCLAIEVEEVLVLNLLVFQLLLHEVVEFS
jgi:hypothetical protein